mgnify:CR=1 FL=1
MFVICDVLASTCYFNYVRSTTFAYGVKSTSSIVINLESFVRLDTFVGTSDFLA